MHMHMHMCMSCLRRRFLTPRLPCIDAGILYLDPYVVVVTKHDREHLDLFAATIEATYGVFLSDTTTMRELLVLVEHPAAPLLPYNTAESDLGVRAPEELTDSAKRQQKRKRKRELAKARAIAMRHCVCMRTLSLLAGPLPSPRRAFLSVSMSRRWRYVVLHASTAGLGGCRCACARVGPISHVDYVPMSPPAPASDPNPNTVTSWAERLASACGFSPGSFFGNLV